MHITQDPEIAKFIYNEIKRGRMRQGWGHREDQNLNTIMQKIESGKKLNKEQQYCWKGNQKLHQNHDDGMQVGDKVLLHNTPEKGYWVMVEVTGNYKYAISKNYDDYGHIRHVKLLSKEPIDYSKSNFSDTFITMVTRPFRLVQIHHEKYAKDIITLEKFE